MFSNKKITSCEKKVTKVIVFCWVTWLKYNKLKNEYFHNNVWSYFIYPADSPCFPNPCENRGTCSVDGASYTCTCLEGFTGDNCETQGMLQRIYFFSRSETLSSLNLVSSNSFVLVWVFFVRYENFSMININVITAGEKLQIKFKLMFGTHEHWAMSIP